MEINHHLIQMEDIHQMIDIPIILEVTLPIGIGMVVEIGIRMIDIHRLRHQVGMEEKISGTEVVTTGMVVEDTVTGTGTTLTMKDIPDRDLVETGMTNVIRNLLQIGTTMKETAEDFITDRTDAQGEDHTMKGYRMMLVVTDVLFLLVQMARFMIITDQLHLPDLLTTLDVMKEKLLSNWDRGNEYEKNISEGSSRLDH